MLRCMGMAVALAFAVLANSVQAGGEKEQEVKLTSCPPAVQKTLKDQAKGSKLLKGCKILEIVKKKEDGKTIYESEVLVKGKKYDIEIAATGKLMSISTKVKLSDLPKSVRKTLMKVAKGGEIERGIEKEVENGKTVYEAKVEINERDYEIVISKDGKFIKKVRAEEEEEEGNNQQEEKEEEGEND